MPDVSLFIPCTVDLLLPSIGEATVSLLRRLGINPTYHKKQTCCGQPAFNAGFRKEAKRLAKHFINVFCDDDIIISPSGSCVFMVKQQYPLLFEDEPEWLQRTEELSQRIFELTEYLVDVLKVEDVGASYSGKVAYHESCHINRCLNISEQPKKLINAVKGAEPVPLDQADVCCGFGGEFSGRYPEISEAMVSEKVENYINSKADLLLLCEPGCLLNIGGFLSRHNPEKKVMHIANFLNGYEQ